MTISDVLIDRITEDTNRYIHWLKNMELRVEKDLFLAGPFLSPEYPVWPRDHDNFHYPLGMRKLLSLGFKGIREKALKNVRKYEGNRRRYLLLIYKVYDEILKLIQKYKKMAKEKQFHEIDQACDTLLRNGPNSFYSACQLYWFSTLFRIGTATIGRMDQHLYPFYKYDVQTGRIESTEARKIVSELLYRYERRGNGKGDTLQNVTVSGRNASGEDQTNDLTYMILGLCIEKKHIEPKINIRVHKKSPEYLLDLVSELQMQGTGICALFNDEAIVEGLMQYGRPAEIASNYCADGCSEIILDGLGETSFRYIDCVKAVEHTLFNGSENVPVRKQLQYYSNAQELLDIKSPVEKGLKTGEFLEMETFEHFYKVYLSQLKYQVDVVLKDAYNSDQYPMRLFTAATMPNVLETACEPYSNPDCFHSYGLFIGSLGTAVNSIAAIKTLIYENEIIDRKGLISALRDSFEGQPMIRRHCIGAPKFGNDDDYVDQIAVDIAKQFASWVKEYDDKMGKPILPGLYNHLFHHTAYSVGATPDGRKFGDPVGEHLSPTPGTADQGPTSVINSVCKINASEHIFGSTLHLNIPSVSLKGTEDPKGILKSLNKAFCLKKGCVLNTNILDVEKLLDAQRNPEKYKDLLVRVWGFSYYFTRLSKELQDHVISRASSTC